MFCVPILLAPVLFLAVAACGEPGAAAQHPADPEKPLIISKVNEARIVELPFGGTSIEERVVNADTIVRATMSVFSSDVLTDIEGDYRIVFKFTLDVEEYLLGDGPDEVTAVWVDQIWFDTLAEANAEKVLLLSERVDDYDDREALIFLEDSETGDPRFGGAVDTLLTRDDHYLLAEGYWGGDDRYSIRSEFDKRWLPSAQATQEGAVG